MIKQTQYSTGLILFFIGLLFAPAALADPGYLWLEPGPQMRRMGGADSEGAKPSGNTNAGMAHGAQSRHASEIDTAESNAHSQASPQAKGSSAKSNRDKETEKKSPREKRAAMSQPAHFTMRLGQPPAASASPEALLAAEAFILRPDGSAQKLVPRLEAPDAVRIRDAALIQGRYVISAFLSRTQGDTHYRLFTQAIMRNTGEKPKGNPPSDQTDTHPQGPRFLIEDISPDPGNNYARVHRKYAGDKLPVRVLLNDAPVANQSVTLATASGWRQTLTTDEKGEVTFALIKESFHDQKINKRPVAYFVTSEIRRPTSSPKGPSEEVLRSALALAVYPSPLDWESQSAGLYALFLAMAAVGVATAIRRRRRIRPCA
ncbi:MAG: hypothetical protein R6W75_00230 [Smithellaceae bacterium]